MKHIDQLSKREKLSCILMHRYLIDTNPIKGTASCANCENIENSEYYYLCDNCFNKLEDK